MKKIMLMLVFVMMFSSFSIVSATSKITVKINGSTQTYDQPPETINNSVMVPLRGIFEELNASLQLEGKKITATKGTKKIILVIGDAVASVDGKQIKLQQKSQVIHGRTLVPLRFVADALGAIVRWDQATTTVFITTGSTTTVKTITLVFPADRYPLTAAHIVEAIKKGESSTCTIDREGADDNRAESLKGISTKDGYDRDEWPMAMCAEGGTGADVKYVELSDNRGSGSWVGNQLQDYPDGTKVVFKMSGEVFGEVDTVQSPSEGSPKEDVTYANCSEVRAAGKAPIRSGDPGYSFKLDRDKDGIGCEVS